MKPGRIDEEQRTIIQRHRNLKAAHTQMCSDGWDLPSYPRYPALYKQQVPAARRAFAKEGRLGAFKVIGYGMHTSPCLPPRSVVTVG